ncbi:MAG: type II toxin-antitoxin system HicB family antitoxin [Anaerolineae bacterium]|jgi:predicted RNase H-like HicB family nuclease/uncharacterized damage-inducible protein DinB
MSAASCLVYLEIAEDGECIAHVFDPPGCIIRAPTRSEALSRVPEAISETFAWLRRHGEPVPAESEPFEVVVGGESSGSGPFDPGDPAALFAPDRKPLTSEEMERHLRLMSYARDDLLALVRDLPREILSWRPDPGSFTIRRLLRHVAHAEKWYVSRLVSPVSSPQEWEQDQELPVLEYLGVERRAVVTRLRQLTEEERTGLFYPSHWTEHPDEPWTARKVLRRLLEHEREHTAQLRRILAARRRHLLSFLAAERAELLWQVTDLDEGVLTELLVLDDGGWTAKDLLAHIAAWDRWESREMKRMSTGDPPQLAAVDDMDAFNAAVVADWRERSLGEVLTELTDARAALVTWLQRLPDEEFFRRRPFRDWDWSFPNCMEIQAKHDAEHAAQIASWRKGGGLGEEIGPKAVLLAALDAAREELLTAAALVPPRHRASHAVCGEWTLRDVVGHVADWEWVAVEGLRHRIEGRPLRVERVTDIEAWNWEHVEARRDQRWGDVSDDLRAAREALLEIMEKVSQVDLTRSFTFPWGPSGTLYQWVRIFVAHDREHAEGVRDAGEIE